MLPAILYSYGYNAIRKIVQLFRIDEWLILEYCIFIIEKRIIIQE